MTVSMKNDELCAATREYFNVAIPFDTNTKSRTPRAVDGMAQTPTSGRTFEVAAPMYDDAACRVGLCVAGVQPCLAVWNPPLCGTLSFARVSHTAHS